MTPLLLNKPIPITNKVIPGIRTKIGPIEGINGVSKTKTARSWVLRSDSKIPIPLPSKPKYKYSRAVILSI